MAIQKKTLGLSFLDVVTESYDLADRDYVRSRLESGTVIGLFDQDSLMGFIGEHTEGAMGMLVVLPDYRRMGVGETLEKLLINKILSEGRTPYCDVDARNIKSLALQEKLGMTRTELDTFWFFKTN